MTSPPERERRPGKGGAESRGGRRLTADSIPPPPDPTYDDEAPELEGYETDPLTADEWSAICLAESRDVALAEVAE